jgi:hypothetical protein
MWIPVPIYKENVAIIAQRAHGMCQNFAEECDYSFHHLGSNGHKEAVIVIEEIHILIGTLDLKELYGIHTYNLPVGRAGY